MNETVIFFHLPKVAGTTINSVILNNIKAENCWNYNVYEPDKNVAELQKAINEKNIQCVTGIMGFGLHVFLKNYKYIVMLRQPVNRVVSYFSHFKRLSRTIKKDFIGVERDFDLIDSENWDIENLLQSRISYQIDNGYVRCLAGRNGVPITFAQKEFIDKEDYIKAKENLKNYFSVIGITEKFNKMMLILNKKTDIKNILYVRKNESKGEKKQVSRKDAESISRSNEFDIQLYEYANDLMEAQFEKLGLQNEIDTYAEELKTYQDQYISLQDKKIDFINNTLKSIDKFKKIAVYSCGEHSDKMFEMTKLSEVNIKYFVDTYKENIIFHGYPVYNARDIDRLDVDVVIISNFTFQNDIISYLKNDLHFKGEIISFYSDNDNSVFYDL